MGNKDYKCFKCKSEFDDIISAIKHLKIIHLIIERQDPIYCLVNLNENTCDKSYTTFSGLKKHAKQCLKNKERKEKVG